MKDNYKIKYIQSEVTKDVSWVKKNWIWLLAIVVALIIGITIYMLRPIPPVKGIVTPDVVIKKEVQKVVDSKKVDSLEVAITKMEKDKLSLEGKLKAAQESNRKLAAMDIDSVTVSGCDLAVWPPNVFCDHTKDDYIQQLQDGAYLSDSLCNEVTKQWVDLSELKDSTIKVLKSDKRILISSFNELGYNSTIKDKAIKDLNRSLRWQKVQKYALIGALGYVAFKTLTK